MNIVIQGVDNVCGSVWIATAILTYQRARELGKGEAPYPEERFAFPQKTIQELASQICSKTVHNARISQWSNADHPGSMYNYLRAVGTQRRLTMPGECGGEKEIPLNLVPRDAIILEESMKKHILSFDGLIEWARDSYPAFLLPRLVVESESRQERGRRDSRVALSTSQSEAVTLAGGADRLVLRIGEQELSFKRVDLFFESEEHSDIFRYKNNKSLGETIRHQRYALLREKTAKMYRDKLSLPLGEFLYSLKKAGDPFYLEFLNPCGDFTYIRFKIKNPEWLGKKGVYVYVLDGRLMYVGRCRDSFEKRINQGYGRIHPKNCFLDGQSTNCRLNNLMAKHRDKILLYVYPMEDGVSIKAMEDRLIATYNPPWNLQGL